MIKIHSYALNAKTLNYEFDLSFVIEDDDYHFKIHVAEYLLNEPYSKLPEILQRCAMFLNNYEEMKENMPKKSEEHLKKEDKARLTKEKIERDINILNNCYSIQEDAIEINKKSNLINFSIYCKASQRKHDAHILFISKKSLLSNLIKFIKMHEYDEDYIRNLEPDELEDFEKEKKYNNLIESEVIQKKLIEILSTSRKKLLAPDNSKLLNIFRKIKNRKMLKLIKIALYALENNKVKTHEL